MSALPGRVLAAAAGSLLCGLAPGNVLAAASCSVSAGGPAFGVYNPLSASPAVATSTVTAACNWTSGSATTVSIVSSYSTGSSATYLMRTLRSGANVLNYNLFFDAAFTRVRGDGTGGSEQGGATLTVSRTNRSASATSTIYGRIPAGQNAVPGSYTDTILVTITY